MANIRHLTRRTSLLCLNGLSAGLPTYISPSQASKKAAILTAKAQQHGNSKPRALSTMKKSSNYVLDASSSVSKRLCDGKDSLTDISRTQNSQESLLKSHKVIPGATSEVQSSSTNVFISEPSSSNEDVRFVTCVL